MQPRAIDRRVEAGRLVRIHPGVYRLGAIRHPLEAEMAAVLALGEGSVISHESAIALHRLLRYPAQDGLVHVTVPGRQVAPKRRVRIHRSKSLPGDERMRLNRIPVTTPARTILDLAPSLGGVRLEQLIASAHRQRPANTKALHTLIARYPRRPGIPAIRALLNGTPEHNLVIEVDGDPFHSTRPDRRRDYARDADLNALGYAVLRFDADEPAERALAVVARATR